MKLEGDYLFDASVPEVWAALFDPVILAAVMPGCEKLDLVDGHYVGEIKVKVGPVQGNFTGKVDLKDKVEPESYTMLVDGRGAPGFVKATVKVKLAPDGERTRVTYDADAQVGGKIASVGQRLIEASARAIAAQSLEGLHTNIKLRAVAYREAAARQAASALSANVPAAGVEPVSVVAASPPATVTPAVPTPSAADEPTLRAPTAGAEAPATGDAATAPATSAAPSTSTTTSAAPAASAAATSTPPVVSTAAAGAAATSEPSKPADLPVSFTPVKVTQAALANAVAKEVASTLFPRSVLVGIILIQAAVIVWLLVR
jgi:uncharacterized protein